MSALISKNFLIIRKLLFRSAVLMVFAGTALLATGGQAKVEARLKYALIVSRHGVRSGRARGQGEGSPRRLGRCPGAVAFEGSGARQVRVGVGCRSGVSLGPKGRAVIRLCEAS